MRIIDAFWEKRNLGVTCYELEMELLDSLDFVTDKLNSLENRQYMVAKIPSSRYDLTKLFQSNGYAFIEVSIKLEYNYKKLNYQLPLLTNSVKQLCEHCTCVPMNDFDIQQMKREINKNMFHTDRVYIDSEFTHEQAARRYNFWVNDLINQGNTPYKYIFNNNAIGFCLSKELASNIYNRVIGGLYTQFTGTGMGLPVTYASFMFAINNGIEKEITHVSGNNPEIFKLHTTFGAVVKEFNYVFVKHNK